MKNDFLKFFDIALDKNMSKEDKEKEINKIFSSFMKSPRILTDEEKRYHRIYG